MYVECRILLTRPLCTSGRDSTQTKYDRSFIFCYNLQEDKIWGQFIGTAVGGVDCRTRDL